ncbi:MAG: DUF4364 family protein [Lachnospiraceae bacterium]|nr:DUF4364 family protein [Lachnospiraceae bacterium]
MQSGSQSPLLQVKLIILYMLDRVPFPLTKAQIFDFVLMNEYTDYITLQQVMSELMDADMVAARSMRNRTHISLTEEGSQALELFGKRLSPETLRQIDTFLKSNEIKLRNEVSIRSEYYKATSGEYEAHLVAMDRGIALANLTLSVPDADTAAHICENWEKNNQEIYQMLVEKLF